MKKIHVFDNDLKVYDDQLLDMQRDRYLKNNVHEVEEEKLFLNAIESLRDGGCFVNIGSAIGYYVILAKLTRKDLHVCAYEPLKDHREAIVKNIELNKLNPQDITIYPEGVSPLGGVMNFTVNNFSSMITIVDSKKASFEKHKKPLKIEKINTITLCEVWRRESCDIDLLQMDIQGLEMDLLKASKNILRDHVIRKLIIGTHSKSIHNECIKILCECGYKVSYDCYETILQPDGIIVAEL